MKTTVILCLIFGVTSAVLAQTNYTAISNLGQPWKTEDALSIANPTGISFTTGSGASYLSGISILMRVPVGKNFSPLTVSLYSDAGGAPGSDLADLSGNSYPTNNQVYAYTNTSPVLLAANTTYWVVESVQANGVYYWSVTTSNAVDAGSSWTLGVGKQYYSDTGWTGSPGYYQQFSVTVTITNVPSLAIFQPVVLTYPNSGFPFALQQNTDLVTPNWVAATNAIQLATVNTNQSVFLVPPSGNQTFYRLSLP